MLPGVLSPEQCDAIIEKFRSSELLTPSAFYGSSALNLSARRCSSYKIGHGELPYEDAIDAALVAETGVPIEHRERWEIIRYLEGDRFVAHYDWLPDRMLAGHPSGQRTHSAVLYLQHALQGGRTLFDSWQAPTVPKGALLSWSNVDHRGTPSNLVRHQAEPVVQGEKWVLVTWMRERIYVV